jgi:hypothetical protein
VTIKKTRCARHEPSPTARANGSDFTRPLRGAPPAVVVDGSAGLVSV